MGRHDPVPRANGPARRGRLRADRGDRQRPDRGETTGGVIGLLNATGRAGAEERHRAQAYSIAQEDQARLRAMQITDLDVATKPRTVTLDGTHYTVNSTATFINDKTGNASCASGTSSADYVKLSSKVTWPSMALGNPGRHGKHRLTGRAARSTRPTATWPSTSSTRRSRPISGVGLTGTGAATFSGSTDSERLRPVRRQPAGNYTLTPTLGSGYVNYDGETPPPSRPRSRPAARPRCNWIRPRGVGQSRIPGQEQQRRGRPLDRGLDRRLQRRDDDGADLWNSGRHSRQLDRSHPSFPSAPPTALCRLLHAPTTRRAKQARQRERPAPAGPPPSTIQLPPST